MKVTIKKFAEGGAALPFVDYMPFTGVASAATGAAGADAGSASGKSGKSSENSPGWKDISSLLAKMEEVLPSDGEDTIRAAKTMFAEANMFNNGVLSTEHSVTTYLSILQKLLTSKFNYSRFKKVEDLLYKDDCMHDIAIREDGRLIVQNTSTGGIQYLTVDLYNQLNKEKPNQFLALTNANLLDYRANSSSFAFKNGILDVSSNGIGEKKVTEMLQNALKGIGTTTLKELGYSERAAGRIKSGIHLMEEAFEQGMTVDGLYKQEMLTKDLKDLITAAMSYLWRVLPNNARTWLQYKSGEDNSTQGAVKLMQSLMFAHNSPTKEFGLNLSKKPGESEDAEGKAKMTFLGNLQAGTQGRLATLHINLGGKYAGSSMEVTGTGYGMAMDPSGKPIDQTSMYDMLLQSRIKGINDGDIYFGEQKVSNEMLRNIAYTGDDILRVNIPVNADGSPNFNLLKIYNQAQQEYMMSNQTVEDLKRIFGSKPELASLLNSDGTLNMSKFAPFILVNGLTTDNLAGLDTEKNDYIHEMKADPNLYKILKLSLTVGKGTSAVTPEVDEYDWMEAIMPNWLNGYDHLYKGVVYIPISMNRGSAAMYGNANLSLSVADSMEAEYQLNPAFLNYNANGNSADLLNN